MIAIIVDMVRKGKVPVKMGDGTAINDYIHVENCATAHVLCAVALLEPDSPAAGQGYGNE